MNLKKRIKELEDCFSLSPSLILEATRIYEETGRIPDGPPRLREFMEKLAECDREIEESYGRPPSDIDTHIHHRS